MNKGFTILELLATIVVISIGVLGAYSVAQKIFSLTFISTNHLTAAYLAQEGVEIVRNARDTNWIEGDDWRDGLVSTNWENTNIPNYERRTTITFNDPELGIVVEVRWSARGDTGEIIIQENLYGWK
ncbi:prepilin-type N-terminal cleavage/methylation domain-containing protein [Patescibacteria group bacterium]|nr:prepilin-type N-terminal cleavage/methylation domain-containing protein [Patescibacteria group bacterium]